MPYRAPVAETMFFIDHCTSLKALAGKGELADVSIELVAQVLEEAGKFASEKIAPLNRTGDKEGTPFANGVVTMPKGWKEVYRAWAEAGWNALPGPVEYGGQGLPSLVNMSCVEYWHSAAMAFGVGPMLTQAAIEAMDAHASDELKERYLRKLVSGEWMGTMQLTEPQSGSDLSGLRTRADRAKDGTYRIKGQKIFITYGEHDLTSNIIHFVLARLPDAPPGTKGISLFLVPKFLVKDDGSLGPRNDLRCGSLEHKLGIHASPTCVMLYGENEGAVGYLIGEENKGLACMFTMMNLARLAVGVEGVADRRSRVPARARLRPGTSAGARQRQGDEPDHRAPGREAYAAHDARAHGSLARDLSQERGRDRPLASSRRQGGACKRAGRGKLVDADCQGVLDGQRH